MLRGNCDASAAITNQVQRDAQPSPSSIRKNQPNKPQVSELEIEQQQQRSRGRNADGYAEPTLEISARN